MEIKNKIQSTGRVTRVDVKFAYITNSNIGYVFVPPCAILPDRCEVPDIRLYLKSGDIVHFTAMRQQGKNNCDWLATKVVLSSNNEIYQAPFDNYIGGQQVVIVTVVTETFAFGLSMEYGTVFVPGAAFPHTVVTKLDSFLSAGDALLVVMRPQAPRSGCSWIAISASRINELNEALIPNCPLAMGLNIGAESSNRNLLNTESGTFAKTYCNVQKGCGIVIAVSKYVACVLSSGDEQIVCPILAWVGGNNGKVDAEGLDEVIRVGETVCYDAIRASNGNWRARNWAKSLPEKQRSHSYTQTTLSIEQMIVRALEPEVLQHLQRKIPHIISLTM